MHWLNKHARLRNQLSPYLDGVLSSNEIASLEAHLGSCEACRAELDQLRATVAATRELPLVDAPRSFALTPQMLVGRRAAASVPSAPPLALGMRLASAGVAVFLAVVVIGDLSEDGGGNGTRQAADESGTSAELASEADMALADGADVAPVPESTGFAEGFDVSPNEEGRSMSPPAGNDTAACPPAAAAPTSGGTSAGGAGGPASTGGAGGATGGGVGGPVAPPDLTATPQPLATPTPATRVENDTGCEEQPLAGAIAPTTSAPQPDEAAGESLSAQAAPEVQDDSGVSTLRVLEIVFAGALLALLAGIAIELAVRRRRAA